MVLLLIIWGLKEYVIVDKGNWEKNGLKSLNGLDVFFCLFCYMMRKVLNIFNIIKGERIYE